MNLDTFRCKYGYDAVSFRLLMERVIDLALESGYKPKLVEPITTEAKTMLEDLRQALL